jgi:hypothetical protein
LIANHLHNMGKQHGLASHCHNYVTGHARRVSLHPETIPSSPLVVVGDHTTATTDLGTPPRIPLMKPLVELPEGKIGPWPAHPTSNEFFYTYATSVKPTNLV